MPKKSKIKLLEKDGKTWSYCRASNHETCSKHSFPASNNLVKIFNKDPLDISIYDTTVIHESEDGETVSYFDYAVYDSTPAQDKPFECKDCNINTLYAGEYYMVHNQIWIQSGMDNGMLCIGCLEVRINRKLNQNDFTDAPINDTHMPFGKSKRLLLRLKSA